MIGRTIALLVTLPLVGLADSDDRVTYQWAKDQIDRYASASGLYSSWGVGNGGYILKSHVDLNGDGIKELLLSSTMDYRRGNCLIQIYGVDQTGEMRPYMPVWQNPPGYYRPGRNNNGEIVVADTFSFAEDGLHVQKFKNFEIIDEVIPHGSLDYDKNAIDFAKGSSWPLVPISVQGIKLSDYVKGRKNWKIIDFDDRAPDLGTGVFLLNEDADEMRANTAFTPQVAAEEFARSFPTPLGERPKLRSQEDQENAQPKALSNGRRGSRRENGTSESNPLLKGATIGGVLLVLLSIFIYVKRHSSA